jgi:outer membrane protein OmpA-like peptidoglycan-associated protein/predicted  nucleic acid-binding Zn-ribbon protein
MADRQRARPVLNGLPVCALLAAAVAALYGNEAAALPPGQPTATARGVIPIADPASPATRAAVPDDQTRAPFAELNAALAAARARLEELSKAAAVAATAGQARQELSAVKQENERLHAELAALQQASHDGQARIAELTKAAEDATAEAKRIDKELVTMRWQNAQLNTNLARAQAARDQALAEAYKAEQTLSAKIDTLTKSTEQSAAETARLRTALADAEHRLEAATNTRSAAEQRVAELQAKVQSAEAKSTRLAEQLTALRSQLAQAESERDKAQARVAELAPEGDRLRAALASAEAEVGQATRAKRDLEQEVAQLRAAAGSAADVARQNLLAVEAGIKQLNAALVMDKPATGEAAPDGGTAGMPKTIPAAAPATETEPGGATAAAPEPRAPAPASEAWAPSPQPGRASPGAGAVASTRATETAAVGADLDRVKAADADQAPPDKDLTRLTSGLPLEKRLQVQGLLVDLGAKIGPWGFELTVPGRGLFATNSDQIEPTAHDTLAKVAELINAYDGHRVQIIGYTDAIGEPSYNKTLSERRAKLVKRFFVDNFDVDGSRLSTEGRGEAEPIASNRTPAGREANRRVEVLVLN